MPDWRSTRSSPLTQKELPGPKYPSAVREMGAFSIVSGEVTPKTMDVKLNARSFRDARLITDRSEWSAHSLATISRGLPRQFVATKSQADEDRTASS
jgi:hypothetical protein